MFEYFGYTKFGTESEHGLLGGASGLQFLGVNHLKYISCCLFVMTQLLMNNSGW
jgi:hypothetical protein